MKEVNLTCSVVAFQVGLAEHSLPGTPVITVTATDRDSGENGRVTYQLISSSKEGFYIDSSNGTALNEYYIFYFVQIYNHFYIYKTSHKYLLYVLSLQAHCLSVKKLNLTLNIPL